VRGRGLPHHADALQREQARRRGEELLAVIDDQTAQGHYYSLPTAGLDAIQLALPGPDLLAAQTPAGSPGRLVRQCVPERRAGGDPELREDPVPVGPDGAVRQEQAVADLLVAQAGGRQHRDLELLRRQRLAVVLRGPRPGLPGGAELHGRPLGPGRGAESPEGLQGREEVDPRPRHAARAPWPLAV